MKTLLFDLGLPMIVPSLALMVVALIPIVLIEALVVGRTSQVSFKKALVPVTLANLVSTFAGIPVTWGLLTLIEFLSVHTIGYATNGKIWTELFSVTLGAPWVAPGHKKEEWIILGAMLFLLIPYGFASWWVELRVIQKFQSIVMSESAASIRWSIAKANLVSYLLLAGLVVAIFAASLRS